MFRPRRHDDQQVDDARVSQLGEEQGPARRLGSVLLWHYDAHVDGVRGWIASGSIGYQLGVAEELYAYPCIADEFRRRRYAEALTECSGPRPGPR